MSNVKIFQKKYKYLHKNKRPKEEQKKHSKPFKISKISTKMMMKIQLKKLKNSNKIKSSKTFGFSLN